MPSSEFAILMLILQTTTLNAFERVKLAKINHLKINRDHKNNRRLADKVINHENLTNTYHDREELDQFRIIQSNVIRIMSPNLKPKPRRTKRTKRYVSENVTNTEHTESQIFPNLTAGPQVASNRHVRAGNVTEVAETEARSKNYKNDKHDHEHKKKKKKVKKGLFSIFHKLHKMMPKFMKKMHGPSMFMMGMAQANFNNFVMHALMMSKMALLSVVMMIIREMVFGDRDEPVKYYNFGYDHHPHRRLVSSYDYHEYPYDYKRRRKRNTKT